MLEKTIVGMATLRVLSGSIEIFAAILMIKFNQIEKALLVNTGLALVGPFILLLTTTIGLLGMADRLNIWKMVWILAGVTCIFIGIRK